jgi:hypothetical protein
MMQSNGPQKQVPISANHTITMDTINELMWCHKWIARPDGTDQGTDDLVLILSPDRNVSYLSQGCEHQGNFTFLHGTIVLTFTGSVDGTGVYKKEDKTVIAQMKCDEDSDDAIVLDGRVFIQEMYLMNQ